MALRLLDLYCGAGGAAEGYRRAGFEILGVDIDPQPRYPFDFVQLDAIALLEDLGPAAAKEYDAIHASPPCQGYSVANNVRSWTYPLLIAETRRLLKATGLPYVIENVPGAPLRATTMLCGTMFGRRFSKHRYFETNWPISRLSSPCAHMGTMKSGALIDTLRSKGHRPWSADEVRWVLDVPWMTGLETRQAIPPVYTEWIGAQLREHLEWVGLNVAKAPA